MAASMAAVLLVAGAEGKRSALPHSRVMIHQPMGGAQGQASDIEITAREIQKLKKELYTIIADHSHTDFDKVWADSDRDYWMTAQEMCIRDREYSWYLPESSSGPDAYGLPGEVRSPQNLRAISVIPAVRLHRSRRE